MVNYQLTKPKLPTANTGGFFIPKPNRKKVSSLNLKPVRPLAEEEQGELLQKNSSLEDTNPNLNHEVRLWGFDLALPNQNFSVSNYRQIFIEAILPRLSSTFLLVGGTGYFLDGIFSPKPTFSIPPDSQLRAELSALTTLDLQQKLKQLDSDKFSQMNNSDQNNPRRLIRAIEVASANRHPTLTTNNYPQITPIWIGLRFSDINQLDEVIVQRVNARFQNPDLASEIKFILKNNWQTFAPSQTLGYPQLISYFQNQITSDQALTEWITKEKQYARRQLTWFKKQPQIKWFSPGEFDSIKDYLASQLN